MQIQLTVNGTLMRGLELNHNLLELGGVFVKEAHTAPCYRLWSIDDCYPAMQRCSSGGSISLEIWSLESSQLGELLNRESAAGLSLGKILLAVRVSSVVYSIQENTVDELTQTYSPNLIGSPGNLAALSNPAVEGSAFGRTLPRQPSNDL